MESDGKRNDRIVTSPIGGHEDRVYESELPRHLYDEIGVFFESYHRLRGKTTKTLSVGGAEEAMRIIEAAREKYAGG